MAAYNSSFGIGHTPALYNRLYVSPEWTRGLLSFTNELSVISDIRSNIVGPSLNDIGLIHGLCYAAASESAQLELADIMTIAELFLPKVEAKHMIVANTTVETNSPGLMDEGCLFISPVASLTQLG